MISERWNISNKSSLVSPFLSKDCFITLWNTSETYKLPVPYPKGMYHQNFWAKQYNLRIIAILT